MMVWTVVLLADFALEFRLEYLWPCWMFFGSVYTTFHCYGLVRPTYMLETFFNVICVVFVCAAFTLDIFCLIFVPLHWLFFVASTYVLFNYIWHTEKGICISTVSLWILLVYTEASLRLKDLKISSANLSHLFAAHCIGYPVVYLGFDATCYFTNIFKLRAQKAVQSDNHFHMHLLQHSLPQGLQLYPKTMPDGAGNSKWKTKPELSQYQCQSGAAVGQEDSPSSEDCLQLHGEETRVPDKEPGDKEVKPVDPPNRRTLSSSSKATNGGGETRDPLRGQGSGEPAANPEHLPQEEQGGRAAQVPPVKSTSPKATRSRSNTNNPSPPPPSTSKTDKKQRTNSKTSAGHGTDAADKAAQNHNAEQINKLEQEFRKLKGELQASRQTEQELKSHICNLTNSERSLRPEVSLLRQSNVLLQSKILCLTRTKHKDKQTSAALEKKIRAEREARVAIEKQMVELQVQKMEEAANSAWTLANRQEHSETQMLRKRVKELETEYKQLQLEYQVKEGRVVDLESDVEGLQKYRCVERDTAAMLSTLSALQDKAQHLEYNLSAETRIKLDLFSALGDARRQLEIAQGKVLRQDREIGAMKQKIAEVMAVSPGVSYMSERPPVPHYVTKLLGSDRYALNPRALMYQCLKK
ncbi:Macoilin [Merluccius polli]|uniref:Macoilin n=1 Tax=Merluccius polli TaxID=89951 RepID=A0AA47MLE8_MERPO|nr:Macoilin [Merluccius polli]